MQLVGNKFKALFEHYITRSSRMNELLDGAEVLSDLRIEADFSYLNKERYGQRFACCGDAAVHQIQSALPDRYGKCLQMKIKSLSRKLHQ
jgi:hypothetical protein